jgi:predicted HD phosphohydrolase
MNPSLPLALHDVLRRFEAGRKSFDRVPLQAHGLQCAARLAHSQPDDLELQVAGLLHDIAHHPDPLTGAVPSGIDHEARHGTLGSAMLHPVFGPRVAALVELHVVAKRYLVSVDPEYRDALSSVSKLTFESQGGYLSTDQIDQFESHPLYDPAIALRTADDLAKQPNIDVPALDHWIPTLIDVHRSYINDSAGSQRFEFEAR